MNNTRKLLALARVGLRQASARNASSNVTEKVNPSFYKLKNVQQRFQTPDDTPVYKKGGLFDQILLGATTVFVIALMGMSGETIYQLIVK